VEEKGGGSWGLKTINDAFLWFFVMDADTKLNPFSLSVIENPSVCLLIIFL
jgi:hypothetical protein